MEFFYHELDNSILVLSADGGLNAAPIVLPSRGSQLLGGSLRTELTRRLHGESTEIFDFGAERCDRVVAAVLARLPH